MEDHSTDADGPFFLGLDFSTQQIKATIINQNLEVSRQFSCSYDATAPEYRTVGGVHLDAVAKTATSPVLMWVKCFDALLEQIRSSGFPIRKISSIGGCAQQHGSVYWRRGSEKKLLNLDANQTLEAQMIDCFSVPNSPVWMDASTSLECQQIEEFVGGCEVLQRLTGSRAYERFTASQIRKISKTRKRTFDETERISLVSSFAASLLLGHYAPTEFADATGTNLFNILEKRWEASICEFCVEGLLEKLGEPAEPCKILGTVAKYFVEKYGFAEACQVVAFTGDTCSSLIGMGMEEGDCAISLGTSDTTFVMSAEPVFSENGHVLRSPVNGKEYILMLGFQNGSAVRERFRRELAGGCWDEFNRHLKSCPKGNNGFLGLCFDTQEITPKLRGTFSFDSSNSEVRSFPTQASEVRALIEGQFLSKKYHLLKSGFVKDFKGRRLFATGGGSSNIHIVQVMSDVFQVPVFVNDVQNSASFGSAVMASYAFFSSMKACPSSFKEYAHNRIKARVLASPDCSASDVYSSLLVRYGSIENMLLLRQ